MDSSSEESFAWTDASDNSTDDETMAKTIPSLNKSGEESESGKTYKKKLQQRLFSGGADEEAATEPSENHQPRKRKLSPHHTDVENIQSTKKKRVKAEPESDADVSKKKKNRSLVSKSQDSSNYMYDESFLNLKVKNEQCFAIPSPIKLKKNKKKRVFAANDNSMNNGVVEEPEMQSISKSLEDSSTLDSSHAEEDVESKYTKIKSKKNKKKSNKKSYSSEVDYLKSGAEKDSLLFDETTVSEPISASADELSDGSASIHNHSKHNKQTKNNQESISISNDTKNHGSLRIMSESLISKRKSRMSERIQFEDEDDSDVQTQNNSTKTPIKTSDTKKLTSFIEESSISLRPFRANLSSALLLTDDDDVWLIRCPRGVSLEAFQQKKWILDSKCKIKLDGQTYEGDIDDTEDKMTVLSSEKDREIIKNVRINGCIRLRRRLPKAHIQEENRMVNNQSNYIPLPDTKCRHPLFGLHYKRAMKLPTGAAQRLRAARAAPPARAAPAAALGRAGKRRHKKEKKKEKLDGDEPASAAAPKAEHVSGGGDDGDDGDAPDNLSRSTVTLKKKKKKRKHSDAVEDESAPRPKRTKRNLPPPEVWESEKAIEENLFNF